MSFITYVYSALNPFKCLQKWNIDVIIVACGRLAEDSLSTVSVIALKRHNGFCHHRRRSAGNLLRR
jgi:hypothetical protein